jgi:hypothetical protein
MASIFAAVLAGVPARIFGEVTKALNTRYPDVMALRGHGTKLFASRLPTYSHEDIHTFFHEAADAVFGSSSRPKGFCRLPHRDCAMEKKSSKSCGNEKDGRACGRRKPDHFFLIYQATSDADKNRLLDSFYFAPSVVELPKESYDHKTRTVDAIVAGVEHALNTGKIIRGNASGQSPATLLPPENFGRKELRKLLRLAMAAKITKADYHLFRREFFAQNKYFKGRSGLAFEPGINEMAHGFAGSVADVKIALTRHYRAGCSYRSDFHWDVSRVDRSDLAGGAQFHCRIGGPKKASGTHINLLPDDCMLGS